MSTTLLLAIVAGIAGRLMRIASARCCSPCWQARFSIRKASFEVELPNGCWPWRIWRWKLGVLGWSFDRQVFYGAAVFAAKSYCQFRADGDLRRDGVGNVAYTTCRLIL